MILAQEQHLSGARATLPGDHLRELTLTVAVDPGDTHDLSGSHLELTAQVLAGLRARGAGDIPVVVGGIVPRADVMQLVSMGVHAVFTPADYDLATVIERMFDAAEGRP